MTAKSKKKVIVDLISLKLFLIDFEILEISQVKLSDLIRKDNSWQLEYNQREIKEMFLAI